MKKIEEIKRGFCRFIEVQFYSLRRFVLDFEVEGRFFLRRFRFLEVFCFYEAPVPLEISG